MIRVFARRTNMTPTDDLAFYDGPPLYEIQPNKNFAVFINVTFTWDIMRGNMLQGMWEQAGYRTLIGGPAFGSNKSMTEFGAPDFETCRFLKKGVTITSRGCPKRCPWCLVHQREGDLREINITPGYIVQDNNLLACSKEHIEKVFEMLSRQKKAAQFKGGLDIDYLQPWHVELMKKIRTGELWVACDCEKDLTRLDKAKDLFSDFSIDKKRCYVLMGFDGDTPDAAERRCEQIYEKGFLPFAQFYQPSSARRRICDKNWHYIVWKWSRPAAYRPKKET